MYLYFGYFQQDGRVVEGRWWAVWHSLLLDWNLLPWLRVVMADPEPYMVGVVHQFPSLLSPQPMLIQWISLNCTGFPPVSLGRRWYKPSRWPFQSWNSPCCILWTLKGLVVFAPWITGAQSSGRSTILYFFLFSIWAKSWSFSRKECPCTMYLWSTLSKSPRLTWST